MDPFQFFWLLGAAAGKPEEHPSWLLDNMREALKELLIGGPWFALAYLIHQIHHRIWHRPIHWVMRRFMKGGH